MSRREESSSSKVNRVFVGNLPPDIRTKDVEDLFYKFGDISFVDLKTRRGPPFAFVEFYDARDAKEAVYSRDGYDYDGYKLRVEFPKGRERVGGGGGGGGGGGRRKSRDRESRRGPPTRRTNHRIKVTGLPATGSWQDLKDHMREAGEVCYADVFKDGTGVVEFMRYDDMKYALKKLDDSRFRSHEGETSYVRVMEDTGRSSGGSRSRSRSRSHSPVTKKSRASPTYSPARDSRSRSRSRSIKSSPGSSRSRSPVNDSHDRSRSRSNHKSRSASRSPAHSDDSRRSRSDSHSSHSRSRSR